MLHVGHLRELGEWRSLVPFLQQVATQIQGTIQLIQADRTVVGKAQGPQVEPSLGCPPDAQYATILTQWPRDNALTWPHETICACGHPLFVLPICGERSFEGILVGCSSAKESRSLLSSLADVIQEYLTLARDAVEQWKKFNFFWNAYEALYERTRDVGNLETSIPPACIVAATNSEQNHLSGLVQSARQGTRNPTTASQS